MDHLDKDLRAERHGARPLLDGLRRIAGPDGRHDEHGNLALFFQMRGELPGQIFCNSGIRIDRQPERMLLHFADRQNDKRILINIFLQFRPGFFLKQITHSDLLQFYSLKYFCLMDS